MWKQELLYVKRNSAGVIIGLSEKDPEDIDEEVDVDAPIQDSSKREDHQSSR